MMEPQRRPHSEALHSCQGCREPARPLFPCSIMKQPRRGQDFGEAAVYSGGDAGEGLKVSLPGGWRTAACISEDLNGHPSVQHSNISESACSHRGWETGFPAGTGNQYRDPSRWEARRWGFLWAWPDRASSGSGAAG